MLSTSTYSIKNIPLDDQDTTFEVKNFQIMYSRLDSKYGLYCAKHCAKYNPNVHDDEDKQSYDSPVQYTKLSPDKPVKTRRTASFRLIQPKAQSNIHGRAVSPIFLHPDSDISYASPPYIISQSPYPHQQWVVDPPLPPPKETIPHLCYA